MKSFRNLEIFVSCFVHAKVVHFACVGPCDEMSKGVATWLLRGTTGQSPYNFFPVNVSLFPLARVIASTFPFDAYWHLSRPVKDAQLMLHQNKLYREG